MISIAISGASTSSGITITDTGRSGYTLRAMNPGPIARENTIAQSRWVDGGALTSTRDIITALDLSIQVWGTDYADLMTKIGSLATNLGQWDYTVVVTPTSGSATTYTCLPANLSVDYDPRTLRANMAVVTAQIPRQP